MVYKYFIISNAIAWLFLFLFPFKAAAGSLIDVTLLNVTFVFFVSCACFPFMRVGKRSRRLVSSEVAGAIPMGVLKCLVVLCYLGFFLIVYDRVILRGIDYTYGLRAARYDWLASESGNIYGVTGNLLSSFAYVGFFVSIYYLQGGKKTFYSVLFLIGVIGVAALNGGRSNLLLVAVMWLFAKLLRGQGFGILFKVTLSGLCIVSLLIGYVVYITNSSAELGGVPMTTLVEAGIADLYGVPRYDGGHVLSSNLVAGIYYMSAYLFHGQWIAQISLSLSSFPGHYFFESVPLNLIRSFLNIPVESTHFDGGIFVSFPGAAFYDYGYLGVISVALLLGCAIGVADLKLRSFDSLSFMNITYCCVVFFYAILSPIAPAHGFAYFSYLLFSFLVVSCFLHTTPRSVPDGGG